MKILALVITISLIVCIISTIFIIVQSKKQDYITLDKLLKQIEKKEKKKLKEKQKERDDYYGLFH